MRSAVAGVLERSGAVRVVIGPAGNMQYHVTAGEKLFILPGIEVEEPVAWDSIGDVVEMVTRHVARCVNDPGYPAERQRVAVERPL